MTRSAKDIEVRPIRSDVANDMIRRGHYSGANVSNSQLHMGVFLDEVLSGVMSFGPPLDRRKMLGLVRGTEWANVLELNRMWFSETLPRNGESRALSVSFRLLRKHAPQVKWVLSFADATQCGDGTIYRASGFVLTDIKTSKNLARMPDGSVIHKMTLESSPGRYNYFSFTGGKYDFEAYCRAHGATVVPGYQFRYIRFVDPEWGVDRLAVPVIPFSDIPPEARMVRGARPDGGAPGTPRG